MGQEAFQRLESGALKRKTKRKLGLFIDGIGLDRATRRLDRKVDLQRLVAGVSEGMTPEVARYYTLVPHEDDARQFAFLDAVERAGLEVVLKRLPPKGVKRQVSMDVHLASDLIAYTYGHFAEDPENEKQAAQSINGSARKIQRIAVVVCPTREVSYALYMSHLLRAETHMADFGLYGASDGWRGVDRWIDLSTSETIWRD